MGIGSYPTNESLSSLNRGSGSDSDRGVEGHEVSMGRVALDSNEERLAMAECSEVRGSLGLEDVADFLFFDFRGWARRTSSSVPVK